MEVAHFFDPQSMDLNSLYQQDVDLGIDWLNFEPVKSVKETELEKKKPVLDLSNFQIDGETGEYLPIPQSDANGQLTQEKTSEPAQNNSQEFNIDDCLDFLETSINSGNGENIPPVSEVNASELTDLASLIQTTESTNAAPISSGIWDDLASLSELTGLTFDTEELTNEESNDGMAETGQIQTQYQAVSQFQNDSYTMPQMQNQIADQQNTLKEQYFTQENQYHSFPTPPYTDQSESPTTFAQPTNVQFSPDRQEEETKMTELLLSQQPDLLLQLDNSQIGLSNSPPPINGNQAMSPGSWFFGGDEPSSNFQQDLADLDLTGNISNQTGPFLNPPNPPYVPPPIGDQGHATMLSESCESDSGVSLDGSFNDGGMSQHMDIEMGEQMDQMPLQENKGLMLMNQSYIGMKSEKQKDKRISQRESRDLKKAREMNIPLTMEQIIHSPVEEYNELIARTPMTAAQQSLVRDIRRRGKNKVAAQNCRKRKIETISSMEIDIEELNMKRQSLVMKQKEIEATRKSIKNKYAQLYQKIFQSLRDETGRPYDPSRFSLEQVEGAVILVPRSNLRENVTDERMDTNTNRTVAFFDLSKVKIEKPE